MCNIVVDVALPTPVPDDAPNPNPTRTPTPTTLNGAPFPPPLPYTLHSTHALRSIALFVTLFALEAGALPIVLFFALTRSAHLSMRTNLAIITSVVGTFSGWRWGKRLWLLWWAKGSAERRPVGAGRWGVDVTQVWSGLALTAFFIPLIIGSSLTHTSISAVSMALPLPLLFISLPLLLTAILPHRLAFPLRLSSFPPHTPLPPLAYLLIEDIPAVDGAARLPFRLAWRTRYEASSVMRMIVRDVSLAWGLGGSVLGGVAVALCWTVGGDVAYTVGYGAPWVWVAVGAGATVLGVRSELRRERREWDVGPVDMHIREGQDEPKEEQQQQQGHTSRDVERKV